MTLNELLLEWSYRSEKGYPSVDSPSDISLLKTILEKLDLPTDDVINSLESPDKKGGDDITVKGTVGQEYSSVEAAPRRGRGSTERSPEYRATPRSCREEMACKEEEEEEDVKCP